MTQNRERIATKKRHPWVGCVVDSQVELGLIRDLTWGRCGDRFGVDLVRVGDCFSKRSEGKAPRVLSCATVDRNDLNRQKIERKPASRAALKACERGPPLCSLILCLIFGLRWS